MCEATLGETDIYIYIKRDKTVDRFWVINNEDEDGNTDERRCRFGEVLIFWKIFWHIFGGDFYFIYFSSRKKKTINFEIRKF